MPLKTPRFWYQKAGFLSFILTPFSWLYQGGHCLYQSLCRQTPYQSGLPVICVGNAIAGGGGKTPSVIALVALLKESPKYKAPYILTRGYGGTVKRPTKVDASKHTIEEVGDEALLLARHAPVIICQNRADGAKHAEELGADIILMDDGFFNKSLHKDINFLVIDRQMDFGNNKTIPAGPLREPLAKVLNKADAIICIGRPFHSDLSVFEGEITVTTPPAKNKKYVAFAGLGMPDKFKNTLLDLNVDLIGWYPFADHHPYSAAEIEQLKQEAQLQDAHLITTEKDSVRLAPALAENIETLPIALSFKDEAALLDFIQNKLNEGKE